MALREAGIATLVVVATATTGCAITPDLSADHESLREAERAFARHAEAAGVRTAFLAAFADDGILMTPAPMRLRDVYAQRPAPADPRAIRLEWEPVASGIAASGELGFTSGPSTLSARDGSSPPRHGAYFSLWKRDALQRWRVVLDVGIVSAAPITAAALLPSPAVAGVRGSTPLAPSDIERARKWDFDAFTDALATDARLYRSGPPAFGEPAIRAALAQAFPLALEPLGGAIASSGDLAYTYGTWRGERSDGHYLHVWTRDAHGAWRIAVAIFPDG